MKYFVINIDDEVEIPSAGSDKPPVEFINLSDGQGFIEALKGNTEVHRVLNDPEYLILVSIDEHLPWDKYDGIDVYQVLGQFCQTLSHETQERIIPIGITSSSLGQRYFPEENRVGKNFFAKLHSPEASFDQQKMITADELFKPETYYDFERRIEVPYSEKSEEAFRNIVENKKEGELKPT